MAIMFNLIRRVIGRRMRNWQDRHRRLGPDCLEISVASCRHMTLVFAMSLISVSIYQVGSVSPDTSDYRKSDEKRTRSTAETGPRLSGNISYIWSPHAVSYRGFPDPRKHLPGRFCFAGYIEL